MRAAPIPEAKADVGPSKYRMVTLPHSLRRCYVHFAKKSCAERLWSFGVREKEVLDVFACHDRDQRSGKGQVVLRRVAWHARRAARAGRPPSRFLHDQDRYVLGLEADRRQAGDRQRMAAPSVLPQTPPRRPTRFTRPASPMAARPAKTRRAFAKALGSSSISPICAIPTATSSARCIGWSDSPQGGLVLLRHEFSLSAWCGSGSATWTSW